MDSDILTDVQENTPAPDTVGAKIELDDPRSDDLFDLHSIETHGSEPRCRRSPGRPGADPTVRNDAGFDFKTYLDIRPSVLSGEAQRRFDTVDAWLDDHGVDLRSGTSA